MGGIKVKLEAEGRVIVAAPLMTDPMIADVELAGFALARFDFDGSGIDFSRRVDLPEELVMQLTGEDELEEYWLSGILSEPSVGNIVLPFTQIVITRGAVPGSMTESAIARGEGFRVQKDYGHGNLLVLAFDRRGVPIWQTFVKRPERLTLDARYVSDLWKIDSNEIHYLHMVGNEDTLVVGRLSTNTGAQLQSTTLLTIHRTKPWFASSRWTGGNTAVLRVGEGDDGHIVLISY